MRNSIRMIAVALALCTGQITAAQAEFTASQKDELNKLFEAYIKENPLVVRDALIALADNEAKERRSQAMAMVALDEGDPSMGAGAEADIVIYEFSDYNCGYCKRVFTQIQSILDEDPKVRLTLKEYPILAESSVIAARAGIAAGMQGKFEPYHVGMMNWRGEITMDAILTIAEEGGIDTTQLQADMASEATENILQRTRATAQALEVSGTPALIIGDEFIPGAISAEQIRQIIQEQRDAAS